MLVLTRGKVHFEILGSDWAQDGEGIAMLVRRLEGILRRTVGGDDALTRVAYTDRGPGVFEAQ